MQRAPLKNGFQDPSVQKETTISYLYFSYFLLPAWHNPIPLPQTLPDAYILANGRIWTADPNNARASFMLVVNGQIEAVGTGPLPSDLMQIHPVFDLEQQMVTPGFIDAHVHFMTGGFGLSSVQLRDARSPQEFIERIQSFIQNQDTNNWVLNGDWDHENWGGELPHRSWIDSISTNTPVWINRLDGHMALANTAAIEAAGISSDTPNIPGGAIDRDSNGELTGIFRDNAMSLIESNIPPPTPQQEDDALDAAMRYVNQFGVTSVHHMGFWSQLDIFQRAYEQGKLSTRIYAVTPLHEWEKLASWKDNHGNGDEWLRTGGLKGFVDGSLGSHTAAFLDPYTDSPEDSGFFVNSEADLQKWIQGADSAGLQVITHAIGDRAIRSLLNIYQSVSEANPSRDRRFRIEHAQHIAPEDLPRFASLDVIPSMQPYHAADDGRWADRVIGQVRSQTTYAFRSLLDNQARIAFGSDWFVAPPVPLAGIHAAVTRQTLDGAHPDGWVPEQKITVDEALRAYTIDAAFAGFSEQHTGSLEAGKRADFVILSEDITEISPEKINEVVIRMTVVDGKVVYANK